MGDAFAPPRTFASLNLLTFGNRISDIEIVFRDWLLKDVVSCGRLVENSTIDWVSAALFRFT